MVEINKIYNEDCLLTMARMPDNFVDLVVTSPPYNCGIAYDTYNDNREWSEYIQWAKTWLTEIKRVMKSDGRLCLNVPLEMGVSVNTSRVSPYAEYYHLFLEIGIKPWGSPVWVDNHRVKNTAWGSYCEASSPYIYNPYEVIMLGYKGVWKKQRDGVTQISKNEFIDSCSGIWKLRTEPDGFTPANFHLDLPDRCIRLLSYVTRLWEAERPPYLLSR